MAEPATIARPYARAAFAHARENGRLAEWARWLATARDVVASADYERLAQSSGIGKPQLVELIAGICGADLDPHGRAFLELLAENQRLEVLPQIADRFDEQVSEAQNVAGVEVVSAATLDDAQQQRLASALRKRLQRDVRLNCTVDPTLIGGALVRSGDLLIDGSLRGKLQRLETELTV